MSDLTLLVNATDTTLLNGSGALPAGAAEGTPQAAPGGGGFAAVLGQQWRPEDGAASPQSSPSDSSPPGITSATVVAPGGEPHPLPGKPLPGEALPTEQSDAPLLEAGLYAAVAQTLPTSAGHLPPATPAAMGVLSAGEEPMPGNMPSTVATLPAANTGQPGSLNSQGSIPGQGSTPSAQQQAPLNPPLGGIATDGRTMVTATGLQDPQSLTGAAIPALLGRPISVAAQQALARAGAVNGASLGRRGESVQAGSGANPLQHAAVANSHMARTDAVLRMDNFSAALTAARHAESTTELRPPVTPPLSMEQGVVNPAANLLEGGLGISGDIPRPGMTAAAGTAPALALGTPVGHAAWAGELGQRVTWLANKELREAQLQLHPRHLGVVEVRIAYGADQQLNISFSAANPIARDALDASLPRLREMLEQQGLQLADANISHQSPSERQARQSHSTEGLSQSAHAGSGGESVDDLLDVGLAAAPPQWLAEGMLDAYA